MGRHLGTRTTAEADDTRYGGRRHKRVETDGVRRWREEAEGGANGWTWRAAPAGGDEGEHHRVRSEVRRLRGGGLMTAREEGEGVGQASRGESMESELFIRGTRWLFFFFFNISGEDETHPVKATESWGRTLWAAACSFSLYKLS